MDQRLTRRLPPRTNSLQRVLLSNGRIQLFGYCIAARLPSHVRFPGMICFAVSFILNGLMFAVDLALVCVCFKDTLMY